MVTALAVPFKDFNKALAVAIAFAAMVLAGAAFDTFGESLRAGLLFRAIEDLHVKSYGLHQFPLKG